MYLLFKIRSCDVALSSINQVQWTKGLGPVTLGLSRAKLHAGGWPDLTTWAITFINIKYARMMAVTSSQ